LVVYALQKGNRVFRLFLDILVKIGAYLLFQRIKRRILVGVHLLYGYDCDKSDRKGNNDQQDHHFCLDINPFHFSTTLNIL
jgi:hypothetical protein